METGAIKEHQRADASHAQFQVTDGRLIRIVEEVRYCVNGILVECGTMADHIEKAKGGGGPGDAAPSDKEEIEPMEAEPEEDPSEDMGSANLVHSN